MTTTEQYLELISSWHRGKPRFSATVEKSLAPLVDLANFLQTLPAQFDLDDAIGAQLDVLGEWIGRSRKVVLPLPGLWFSFDVEKVGWDEGIWRGPYDDETTITSLDDETYRSFLRAKIISNNWDGTVETAQVALDLIAKGSGSLVFIQDNADGSMTLGVSGRIPSALFIAMVGIGYIPLKPSGVSAYYLITTVNEAPLFGFDVENDYVAGFESGAWGREPDFFRDLPVT